MNRRAKNLFQGEPMRLGNKTIVPSTLDVAGRLHIVAHCDDPALLRAALDTPALQKTVRDAIERRLRRLRA